MSMYVKILKTENRLLYMLANQTDFPVERDTLLEMFRTLNIYHIENGNFVDVYIRKLRKKLDAGRNVNPIQTIRGVGYVLSSENPEDKH